MKAAFRIAAAFITAAILLSLLPAQALAASTKATTLRLEDTQGDTTVLNARGKQLSVKPGAKLYNGYAVSTEASGYAWISLDEDVVIKLDSSSKATVKQNGKKLEIQLDSGNLLFNVNKPLSEDTSLDIRTSSMSTGVRGTSGLVAVNDTLQLETNKAGQTVYKYIAASRLVILDGTVTVAYDDLREPGYDQAATTVTQVPAGWQATVSKITETVSSGTDATSATDVKAEVRPVSIQQSLAGAGYAVAELAANPALLARVISADNDLDESAARELTDQAAALIEQEQRAKEEQSKKAEEDAHSALEQAQKEMAQHPSSGTDSAPIITVFPADPPAAESTHHTPPPLPPPDDRQWTISYVYQDELFAEQIIQNGALSKRPELQPTKHGEWMLEGEVYEFGKSVNADISIIWVSAQ